MDPNAALLLNGGDDEDDALRRAIALSLGGGSSSREVEVAGYWSAAGRKRIEAIDLTSPSPESKAEPTPELAHESASLPDPAPEGKRPVSPPPVSSSSTQSSLFGLDRKKMEEERLARLSKRKASDIETNQSERPAQKVRLDNGREVAPLITGSSVVPSSSIHNPSATTAPESIPFPNGIVKRTWLQGQPRSSEDITIEEILHKDKLELAVLSSFVWDTNWLWTKIDPMKTKTTLIAFAGNEAEKAEVAASAQGIARICFPPMNGSGCMHSKLQLLKFPDYLRIVIPSGNLVPFDWGEQNGIMENSVFIIDLPPVKPGVNIEDNVLTSFGEELSYFLTAQGLNRRIISSLRKYDFGQTSRYAFVHTIAGVHTCDKWKRTGYCGLGRAIQNLGLATAGHIEIDYIASSIGSLKYSYLAALYSAFQGDSGLKDYQSRASKSNVSKDDAATAQKKKLQPYFRIYFPSLATVEASRGGARSAGTICLQRTWWEASSFPRDLFLDYQNPRGALVHSKIIFARPSDASAAWAYVGSANLSESAWGNLLVKDRASAQPKMSCRNWECGVIVPVGNYNCGNTVTERPILSTGDTLHDASAGQGDSSDNTRHVFFEKEQTAPAAGSGTLAELFRECVPLPMELPGRSYMSADGRKVPRPWFYR